MLDKDRLIFRLLCLVFWALGCWGFVCTDLLPSIAITYNLLGLLCDAVLIATGIATVRSRRDKWVLWSFILLAAVSSLANRNGLLVTLNGMRLYLGLLFAAPAIRSLLESPAAKTYVESFDRQLLAFLWVQTVCVTMQFVRYGAGDWGGGSLGYGASGLITTLIYLISFYLVNRRWDERLGYWANLWVNRKYIFLLFPTFLNETKVSLVFIMAYFVLLMHIDRRMVLRLVLATPVVTALMAAMGYVYVSVQSNDLEYDADFFIDYLLGLDIEQYIDLSILVNDGDIETDNQWVMDLPRYGRFLAVPEALDDTGGGWLLGAGVGQLKGGTLVAETPFAVKYAWLLKGSRIFLFAVLIELGIAGVLWALWAIVSLILTPGRNPRGPNIRCYLFMLTVVLLAYNDTLYNPMLCLVFTYVAMMPLQPAVRRPGEGDGAV